MGALHALYQYDDWQAADLAKMAVEAGAAFDVSSRLPIQLVETQRQA